MLKYRCKLRRELLPFIKRISEILNKMEAEPRPDWKPIYRDLEKIPTAEEFATQVYNDVQQFLGATTRAINFVRRFFEKAETDYVDIKERRWKELLSAAIKDLMQSKQHPRWLSEN